MEVIQKKAIILHGYKSPPPTCPQCMKLSTLQNPPTPTPLILSPLKFELYSTLDILDIMNTAFLLNFSTSTHKAPYNVMCT